MMILYSPNIQYKCILITTDLNKILLQKIRRTSKNNSIIFYFLSGGNITVITALANTSVSLPCDISLPNNHEKVTLILWYREDLGVPIYR